MQAMHGIKTVLKNVLPEWAVSTILRVKWERMKEVDLQRTALIKSQELSVLTDAKQLEDLLPRLGLNNELLHQLPDELYPYTGEGLFYWQYPNQFAPYLLLLSRLNIQSYLEIGVRHGGTFILTAEYLQRFAPLTKAVGVDLGYAPSVVAYSKMNKAARFFQADSQTERFKNLLKKELYFDLVLIDGNHEAVECRNDYEAVKDRAGIIVLHDIVSVICPGVQTLWRHLKLQKDDFIFYEFTAQYDSVLNRTGQSFFGIGVAVKKTYLQQKQITLPG